MLGVNGLLDPLRPFLGEPVLLAVSGGADSVGLLRAALELELSVVVAHFDHRLRPDSALDAEWTADLCRTLGVAFEPGGADVARVAAAKGWNVEDAARRLRYAFLARAARAHGADHILTAHTRADQAETVLHQLLRGEHALTGIASQSGRIARPWLGVERADIETYLRALGQGWREDPSNADPRFTRNWLRHEVLAVLRGRFPNLNASLARHAALQSEDEALLAALAAAIPAHADLSREPPALLRRFVAGQLHAARLTFHAAHLDALVGALRAGETRHVTLPGGRDVTVTGGALHLAPRNWPRPDFDLPPGWTLRHREAGDRIKLGGGTRKVSDVLTDRKVPRGERDEVWLLAEGRDVRWVGLDPPVWAAGAGESAAPWWAEMGDALAQARLAARAGEVPVGAVVVCGGKVVAAARNTSREAGDMTRHAELLALQEAARVLGTPYLTDCTLVVTLEPCPMCYGAAIEARVARIVFGADNPKLGALGGVSDLSRAAWGHAPAVTRGLRAREAGALLRTFFEGRRG